jgi:hypothetical protein
VAFIRSLSQAAYGDSSYTIGRLLHPNGGRVREWIRGFVRRLTPISQIIYSVICANLRNLRTL